MSTTISDQAEFNGDMNIAVSTVKSVLSSLSQIMASVESAKLESNIIHEIGSYYYRVSLALKELADNNSDSVIKLQQYLSESEDLAKGILGDLQQSGQNISDHDLKTLINQLQGIINHMGEALALIPVSAFNDEKFAEAAISSLSEDMRRCNFDTLQVAESNPDSLQKNPSHKEDHPEDQYISVEDLYSISRNDEALGTARQRSERQETRISSTLAGSMTTVQQNPSRVEDHPEVESVSIEEDLYTISTIVCTENSHVIDALQIEEALRARRQRSQRQKTKLSSRLKGSMTIAAQHAEPLYQSFCCPLTKKIMEDPVTIQSGVTYERKAITDYFDDFRDSSDVNCPVTREKLQSRAMSPNIALRNIIQEWRDRNDSAQLKVIRAAFSIGSTDDMILEALQELQSICQRSPKIIKEVHNIGIIPLLVRVLESKDRNVRCMAIEMIRELAMEHEGKELIGRTPAIASVVRQLSSGYKPIRHAALLLLIELSKSRSLTEKIGSVRGGILILVQTKYNRSLDTFASEAADQVLKNLEQCPNNVKLMAENGFLEPLLNNLIEGNLGRKLQMVNYLGEITLEEDSKPHVIERTSPILIQMLDNENGLTRKAVFKAFAQTSSNPACGKTLVEAGIVRIIVDELFTQKLLSEQTDSLKEASTVLVNILESGVELENLMINSKRHTMASGYVVFNIMNIIKNSKSDDLKLNLVRILYQIAKSTKSAAPVVSAVKESESSYTLVELLNSPSDEMAVSALKLLTLLSSHIGHLLIEKICKTNAQPEGLVQSLLDPGQITERQALSVCLLAKLPHENVTLNAALASKNTVPGILHSIFEIRRATRQNRYSRMYLEGLVGILVRFTATLYDSQILFLAINQNFTREFTDLLTETSVEEVQRLAATGLEKLSAQSIHLSNQPRLERKMSVHQYLPGILACGAPRKTQTKLCLAHKGVCSEQNTFCLIEANAVERLLLCLENPNVEVAQAALSALSTLVDDKVDINQSVSMLIELNAIQQIMKALKYHKDKSLWHKALWVLEKFLMKGGQRSLSILSQDKLFYVSVVTAFHHGDTYTKQIAEKILTHLEQMPSFTNTFTM
ncbi:putative U-box domain-containing protein 42 [Silene latifolia]|uniref:putative U-box domain-containing protein 42 n=1 Tax=Silene latifolia TaxID=37657 RepID=UPI003D783463